MKIFQLKQLMALLLLSLAPFSIFSTIDGAQSKVQQVLTINSDEEEFVDKQEEGELVEHGPLALTPEDEAMVKKSYEFAFKLQKEIFVSKGTTFLNKDVVNDQSFHERTTLDGSGIAKAGRLEKNPLLEVKGLVRFRYNVGSPAIVKTATTTQVVAGAPVTIAGADTQKTLLYLRELMFRLSLDQNPKGSKNYIKIGSFPFQLGRGIALGSAYISSGFMDLDPRFSIDQFAPGAQVHVDGYHSVFSGDLYYSILSNPNTNIKENNEPIFANQIRSSTQSITRGPDCGVWLVAAALQWKAINNDMTKLTVDPYTYLYNSPDQQIEFPADSDARLYGIGTAIELKTGRLEIGFDATFQGGAIQVKAWDRNYTNLVNSGIDGDVIVQYTKVYTNAGLTTLAPASTANQAIVKNSTQDVSQNGKQIGTTGLYNANDRFRPQQQQLVHSAFFVLDASYAINDQLKVCVDTGYVSGQLDLYEDANTMTQEQLMNQQFYGFVPIQEIYAGKRIQHLVMLNKGIPRFVVQYPQLASSNFHVTSRVTGTKTLTDKFTNLAYAGGALEYKPVQLSDQKFLLKPSYIYYWMPDAPMIWLSNVPTSTTVLTPAIFSTAVQASHALGTALCLEVGAVFFDCLECGGFIGLMLPGKQYKQFAGTQLKPAVLGSDLAYLTNFSLTYKF